MYFQVRCIKLDVWYELMKESRMFPKILPGLVGKIEFLSSETEKISGGTDFLRNIQSSVFVSLVNTRLKPVRLSRK